MYKIMVVKQARSNYKSLYQFMLTEDESGQLVPLELNDFAELDQKIETMLNDEGYAKSDFIAVDTIDYKILATGYTSSCGCLDGADSNAGLFFDSGYVDGKGYLHLTKDGEEISNFEPFLLEEFENDVALPTQATLHASCNPTVPEVTLNWGFTDIDNTTGVMIRRKQGEMPSSLTDGELVCDKGADLVATYTDTDFTDDGIGTMDNPITYYYRAFAYNLTSNGKAQYQTSIDIGVSKVNVYYLEDSTLLGSIGKDTLTGMSLVFARYGTAEENDLTWSVVHVDEEQQIAYLMLAKTPIGNMQFDAAEKSRDSSDPRYGSGYSRWAVSNIRQWLNTPKGANGWYEAQHDYDAAPSYTSSPGFLHYFTEAEIDLIVPQTHTLILPSSDGGGTETVVDTVWLPSTVELGLQDGNDEGSQKFDAFSGNTSRRWDYNYWTRSINGSSNTQLRYCSSAGALSFGNANYNIAARAGLVLPLTTLVKYDDDKGMYRVVTAES